MAPFFAFFCIFSLGRESLYYLIVSSKSEQNIASETTIFNMPNSNVTPELFFEQTHKTVMLILTILDGAQHRIMFTFVF